MLVDLLKILENGHLKPSEYTGEPDGEPTSVRGSVPKNKMDPMFDPKYSREQDILRRSMAAKPEDNIAKQLRPSLDLAKDWHPLMKNNEFSKAIQGQKSLKIALHMMPDTHFKHFFKAFGVKDKNDIDGNPQAMKKIKDYLGQHEPYIASLKEELDESSEEYMNKLKEIEDEDERQQKDKPIEEPDKESGLDKDPAGIETDKPEQDLEKNPEDTESKEQKLVDKSLSGQVVKSAKVDLTDSGGSMELQMQGIDIPAKLVWDGKKVIFYHKNVPYFIRR